MATAKKKKTSEKQSKPRKVKKPAAGSIVFSELNTTDVAFATSFYCDVLGLESKQLPMGDGEYTILTAGGNDLAGVVQQKKGQPLMWVNYHATADIQQTLARAVERDARVLVEPTMISAGIFAILQDPTGAVFGLLQPR